MKKFVTILAAVLMMFLAIMPMASAASTGEKTMYVYARNGGVVNVRDLPTVEAGKSLVQLGCGFPVTVRDTSCGWAEVKARVNGKDVYGYMDASYLTTSDPAVKKQSFRDVTTSYKVAVRPSSADGRVNLWPSCSKKGTEIRTLRKGEKLTVVAYSNAWYKVVDVYGNTGYVAKAYVKK